MLLASCPRFTSLVLIPAFQPAEGLPFGRVVDDQSDTFRMESVVRYRLRFVPARVVSTRFTSARFTSAWARSTALLAIVIALGSAGVPLVAGPIEAIRGKAYPLTAKHGPWMIKVASLLEEAEHQEAPIVKELVYQLRKKGIPAYTHRQTEESEEIESVDRQGRTLHRRLTSQRAMIAVLAGNYKDPDDKAAQQTLKYIKDKKKISHDVTVEWQGKDVPVPLAISKAFLTRNPLLPADELAKRNRDPLILKLNSGLDHSLFENKGKYTVIVASFFGKSQVSPAKFQNFENMFSDKSKVSLDNAAQESWKLMSTLRKLGIEAYVYHDRYKSIVTVGAFKSQNDPEIQNLVERFKAKEERDPKTGKPMLMAVNVQVGPDGIPQLLDDPLHGPNRRQQMQPVKSSKPVRKQPSEPFNGWIMDPQPQLMEVPK